MQAARSKHKPAGAGGHPQTPPHPHPPPPAPTPSHAYRRLWPASKLPAITQPPLTIAPTNPMMYLQDSREGVKVQWGWRAQRLQGLHAPAASPAVHSKAHSTKKRHVQGPQEGTRCHSREERHADLQRQGGSGEEGELGAVVHTVVCCGALGRAGARCGTLSATNPLTPTDVTCTAAASPHREESDNDDVKGAEPPAEGPALQPCSNNRWVGGRMAGWLAGWSGALRRAAPRSSERPTGAAG